MLFEQLNSDGLGYVEEKVHCRGRWRASGCWLTVFEGVTIVRPALTRLVGRVFVFWILSARSTTRLSRRATQLRSSVAPRLSSIWKNAAHAAVMFLDRCLRPNAD